MYAEVFEFETFISKGSFRNINWNSGKLIPLFVGRFKAPVKNDHLYHVTITSYIISESV